MSYTPAARRKRRRRTLTVLAVVGSFLAIAYGITRAQGEAEMTRAYLDIAFEVTNAHAESADTFVDLVVNIEDYNRATLLERLDGLERQAEDAVSLLTEQAEPPGDLEEANVFLRVAVSAWRSGISDSRAGLVALSSNPLDEDGLTSLARGLIDLRVGDRAYRGFLSRMSGVDTTLQGGPLPSVAFVPSAEEALYEPRDLARRMFLAGSLAPVDDLAIADVKLEPGPVGESEGLPVLAVTANQSAAVTISNRGNTDVTGIKVRLRLLSNTGQLYEAEQDISGLEAGALTALVYSDLPVEPGTIYEIDVSLTRKDDDDSNDSFVFRFVVNRNE